MEIDLSHKFVKKMKIDKEYLKKIYIDINR